MEGVCRVQNRKCGLKYLYNPVLLLLFFVIFMMHYESRETGIPTGKNTTVVKQCGLSNQKMFIMENQSFFEKPLGELMSILENDGKKIASRVDGNYSTDLYLYNEDLFELHYKDQVPVRLHQMVDEAADEYLSNTFNLEAWEEGDYRVALRCPFTGETVYDSDGYHEPYPKTLLMMVIDKQPDACYDFKILDKIWNLYLIKFIDGIVQYEKKETEIYSRKCILFNPTLDWNSFFDGLLDPGYFLAAHGLVEVLWDPNDYEHYFVGEYVYYFAREEDQPVIMDYLLDWYQFLRTF